MRRSPGPRKECLQTNHMSWCECAWSRQGESTNVPKLIRIFSLNSHTNSIQWNTITTLEIICSIIPYHSRYMIKRLCALSSLTWYTIWNLNKTVEQGCNRISMLKQTPVDTALWELFKGIISSKCRCSGLLIHTNEGEKLSERRKERMCMNKS